MRPYRAFSGYWSVRSSVAGKPADRPVAPGLDPVVFGNPRSAPWSARMPIGSCETHQVQWAADTGGCWMCTDAAGVTA